MGENNLPDDPQASKQTNKQNKGRKMIENRNKGRTKKRVAGSVG